MEAFLMWFALGLSQADMESRARGDLSTRRGVALGDVRVVASEARTWPDRRLGCLARRGVEEPIPVPGYRIVLEADGVRETYHTDRQGRILRCETTSRRLLPMLR
jgi:hypothetical protein